MLEMVDSFADWLLQQLNQRGWSQAELARNADVSRTAISDVISGKHSAGFDLCVAISHALKLPPETVFRAAGLLPSKPETNERITEALYILSMLGEEDIDEIIQIARMKLERKNNPTKASRKIKPARTVLNGQ